MFNNQFCAGTFKKCFFFLRWPWLTIVEDVCSPAWVIRKQSEKSKPENKFDHTHKKTPLQLNYTSSKNWHTTTRPTSQAPVCRLQYSPDHYIVHTRPNPSIHKALTSEFRRWYGIERTFLDFFFWHFPVIYVSLFICQKSPLTNYRDLPINIDSNMKQLFFIQSKIKITKRRTVFVAGSRLVWRA